MLSPSMCYLNTVPQVGVLESRYGRDRVQIQTDGGGDEKPKSSAADLENIGVYWTKSGRGRSTWDFNTQW